MFLTLTIFQQYTTYHKRTLLLILSTRYSNEIHNVVSLSKFFISDLGFSSTCFGPHRSIIRSFYVDTVHADYGTW